MAAPVVPTTLAMTVPSASSAVLVSGVPRKLPGHQDAARDRVEREQQHDEAEVFAEHGVHERRERGRARPYSAPMAASVSAPHAAAILP